MARNSDEYLFLLNLYTVLKDLLGFNTRTRGLLQLLITTIFGLACAIILFACLTPFFIFYHCLNLYLKLRIGRNYVGLLKGQDSIMECESKKLIVNLVVIINRKTPYKDFIECVKGYMKTAKSSSTKLSYLIGNCLGYCYFTKGDLEIEEYLNEVDFKNQDVMTKEILRSYLNTNYLDERPLKNKMWQVTTFKQPIIWSKKSTALQQVLIFSIRHSLCDGISILGFLKNKVLPQIEINVHGTKENKLDIEKERYVYENCFIPHDTNARIKPIFKSDEFLSIFAEESIKYVPLVKQIKDKLRIGFSDVLVTAIAEAVAKYAEKKNIELKKHIASVAISPFTKISQSILIGNCDFNKITNRNGVLHFVLPTRENPSLAQNALRISETIKKALGGSEVVVTQVLTKLFYLFPTPLLSLFLDEETRPACFELSNMSGLRSCVIGENSLESAIFFTTQMFKVGFLFCVMTIGDKFQISIKSDRGMVESQEELDEILSDVFRYLDQMRNDTRSLGRRTSNSV